MSSDSEESVTPIKTGWIDGKHYHDDGTLCLSSDHEDPNMYDHGVPTDEEADKD